MEKHARIAPSGLTITTHCPGAVRMQEQVEPTPDTDEELEGQVAHRVAMGVADKTWEPKVGDKLLHAGREFEIDEDMIEGAELYAEEAQIGGRFEDPVSASHIIPECWGTPDYWRLIDVSNSANMVKVIDYKFGYRNVEVFENPQLVAYAFGVQARLQLPWETPVCLTIVQPRSYHHEGPIREWREFNGQQLTLAHLWHFAAIGIIPAVKEALGVPTTLPTAQGGFEEILEPRTISGPHCVDCKARHLCPTYRKSTGNVLQYVGTAQPDQMTPQAVGAELRLVKWAIKMLEGREAGLRAHAEAAIKSGQQIPYWRYESVPGRLKWKPEVSAQQRIALGDVFGVDLRKPQETITPTQAKKLLAESVVMEYADRPPGAAKLIPDDEKQFRKVFGHASRS